MRRASFAEMNCSVAQSLEVVGEWWTLLIVRDALLGVTRFEDFADRLGIARNVLTQRLEVLVEHGVLTRRPYESKPLRYEYVLTEKGIDLWRVIDALRQWGDRWVVDGGAPIITVHRDCGHAVEIAPTCPECGGLVSPSSLRVLPGPGFDPQGPLAAPVRSAPVTDGSQ